MNQGSVTTQKESSKAQHCSYNGVLFYKIFSLNVSDQVCVIFKKPKTNKKCSHQEISTWGTHWRDDPRQEPIAFQPFFSNLGVHLNSLQLLPPRLVILLLKNQAEKLQHFRVQDHNIGTMLHTLLHQAFTGVILCTPQKKQHPGQV